MKDLMEEIQQLRVIPESSASAYRKHLRVLTEQVNETLLSRDDIENLIGQQPLRIMLDNHRNHGAFMANVFMLNAFELLGKVIPWVYRTYHNLGFSFDYFPVHLRAWKMALQETLPKDTAGPVIAVYDWMLKRHAMIINIAEQQQGSPLHIDPQWKGIYEEFLEGLLMGDRKKCVELIRTRCHTVKEMEICYLQIIQPAMYRIGELWEQGRISVSREHLASAMVTWIMAVHYAEITDLPEIRRGKAVVTACPNEYHEIGAWMVANCLESDGWDVEYLGANTPEKALLEFVADEHPAILALSASMPFNLEHVGNIISIIRSWNQADPPKILLGGLAFSGLSDLPKRLGADGFANDCHDAVLTAKGWWEEINR